MMRRSPIPIASLHRPGAINGVSMFGNRLAHSTADLPYPWRPILVGPELTARDVRTSPFDTAEIAAWAAHAPAFEQLDAVRAAVDRVGATIIVSHDLPHGYLSGALDRSLHVVGYFHGDDLRDHDFYERAAPLCHTWRAVSSSIARTIADIRNEASPPLPLAGPIDVPASPEPMPDMTDGLRLAFVGALVGVKRPHDLARLADALRERHMRFHLDIVGDGPLADSLTSHLQQHVDTGTAKMHGTLTADERDDVLRCAHMLVLPSLSEGAPLAAIEAMRLGRPVAVTNTCGAVTDLVRTDGDCGLIFDTGSIDQLADSLQTLTSDLLRDMGRRAHKAASEHFDTSTLLPRFEALRAEAWEATTQANPTTIDQLDKALALLDLLKPEPLEVASESERRAFIDAWLAAHKPPPAITHTARSMTAHPGPRCTPLDRHLVQVLQHLHASGASRIALYGAGRHTERLAWTLAHNQSIVAILDDNATEGQQRLGRPMMKPHAAATLGIDAVIISSDVYEDDMLQRAHALGLPATPLYFDRRRPGVKRLSA